MSKVLLRRTWFAPNGHRYRQVPGGTEIPNSLMDRLPKDAVLVNEDGSYAEKTVSDQPYSLSQIATVMNPPLEPADHLSEGGHGPLQVHGLARDPRQRNTVYDERTFSETKPLAQMVLDGEEQNSSADETTVERQPKSKEATKGSEEQQKAVEQEKAREAERDRKREAELEKRREAENEQHEKAQKDLTLDADKKRTQERRSALDKNK